LLARIGQEKNQTLIQTGSNFVTLRADQGKWSKIAEGAFIKKLFVDEVRRTVTSLVKLNPGGRLEGHRHHSTEECYILEGDYHINGEVLGPGDYHCALPGSVDEELFTVGGTIFLLIAPLRHDPLKTETVS
jgi:quercetin dioxygenase-like cupin family protein